nr:reverse transcriptase domain-containing protein [Tanacetum cinerariifolium]
MGCLLRSACLGSLSLTQFPEFNGHWGMFGDQGKPSLFEDQSLHVLRPSRLCAQAQLGDDRPFHKQACMEYTQLVFCKLSGRPREHHITFPTMKHDSHLLSFQGYILNHGLIPPPDHLFGVIRDFKQKGVVLKIVLHIFKEFVLLLGRHFLNNEVPCMEENPPEQSRLGIIFSKEIFDGGVIRIHNAFVQDEDRRYGKVACIAHKLEGEVPIGVNADEPPEVELKDLPPHIEYAFLEGDDKLPIIIAKDLSVEEKDALIKVLKSHKQAIAWKLSDIKGINPEFYTHKILIEDDFKPAVQHQRRVNPKIHDVIIKEVLKLLDAGLIYPISDSPWVSPVHCVPKKDDFTVVENEENELILTRLVMGWHVCIDYHKLNEATRKDHFPLPFMDQMLERLAGNKYYCFLDGLSGYF